MTSFNGFPKGCIPYLKRLARNNERAWFNENKPRYEDCVREPALAFIEAMAFADSTPALAASGI